MWGKRLGCSDASAAWSGNYVGEGQGQGRCQSNNRRGVGVAADGKEAFLNEKAGAYAGVLAPVPLLGSDITDEEGVSQKDNPLAAVNAPAEASTAGVVTANAPKKKSASRKDEAT